MDTLPGKATLLKLFYLPSEKSSTLKKIICFQGGECLIFRDDSLPKGGWSAGKQTGSHTQILFIVKLAENTYLMRYLKLTEMKVCVYMGLFNSQYQTISNSLFHY